MNKFIEDSITFDDVLIQPTFCAIKSRKDVVISSDLGGIKLDLPIISANMKTITESKMAMQMREHGGLGILHRFCTIEENVELYKNSPSYTGVSIGVTDGEKERAEALIDKGAFIFCIDVANGASLQVVNQLKWLRQKYRSNIHVMVGNFATYDNIETFKSFLNVNEYPNSIKVGLGSGHICSTRSVTGVGRGQISIVMDCVRQNIPIVSDGGHRKVADICKSLAAGAKFAMLGSMLSGTDETPGEIIYTKDNKTLKKYQGSAYLENIDGNKTSEGVSVFVENKGPVSNILKHISGGIRSSFTYVNALNLNEYQEKTKFYKVTNSVKEENKTLKD